MNIKLNNIVINPEYNNLFEFKNDKERLEHNAQMISYRILSEVEKVCNEKKIKKKDLANMIGTSKSYITQLFRGAKSVNTLVMAKFEEALDFSFNINIKLDEESSFAYFAKHLPADMRFGTNRLQTQGGTWYYCADETKKNEIVGGLETENKENQIAA